MRNSSPTNLAGRAAPPSRPAFTLLELLVGVVLLAMILGAVALAIQGAADATAYGADKGRSLTAATLALNRFCTDARRAADVIAHSPRSVTITFPDGQSRSYSWSGIPGDPLLLHTPANPDGNVLVAHVVQFNVATTRQYSYIVENLVTTHLTVILEAQHGNTATRLQNSVQVRRNIM